MNTVKNGLRSLQACVYVYFALFYGVIAGSAVAFGYHGDRVVLSVVGSLLGLAVVMLAGFFQFLSSLLFCVPYRKSGVVGYAYASCALTVIAIGMGLPGYYSEMKAVLCAVVAQLCMLLYLRSLAMTIEREDLSDWLRGVFAYLLSAVVATYLGPLSAAALGRGALIFSLLAVVLATVGLRRYLACLPALAEAHQDAG